MDILKKKFGIRSIMGLLLSSMMAVTMVFGMLGASSVQVKAAEDDDGIYTIDFENSRGWWEVYCRLWKENGDFDIREMVEYDFEPGIFHLYLDPSEGFTKIQFCDEWEDDCTGFYDISDMFMHSGSFQCRKSFSDRKKIIVQFVNTLGWEDVYIYANNGESGIQNGYVEWPGVKMELYGESDGYDVYRYDFSGNRSASFTFSNGAGEQFGATRTDENITVIPEKPEICEVDEPDEPIIPDEPVIPDEPIIPDEPSNLTIVEENNMRYCVDQDGNKLSGLQTVNGDLYYFGAEGDGTMKYAVQYIDGKIYYFGEDGKAPKTQFVTPYYDTYYCDADGRTHTGWLDLDGEKYYADEMGTILKGVQTIDGNSYLFDRNDNGKMVTNKMAHDWEGTQNHYYGDDGVMQTGFITYEGNTYYFYEDGTLARGWQTIDGNTYFFDNNNGIMATGTTFIYWRDYEFDENGVLQGEI